MIKEFVERFDANRANLREKFKSYYKTDGYSRWEIGYKDIVREVIDVIKGEGYEKPDPERIHEIDDGDYQGTLLYVIAADNYQPDIYWYVKVGYGSCSGCDTLLYITECEENIEQVLDDLMTLALHIVQGLHKMDGEEA